MSLQWFFNSVVIGRHTFSRDWKSVELPVNLDWSCLKENYLTLKMEISSFSLTTSVTRLGDLLDFGQLFKAFGNIYVAQISYILRKIL